MGEVNLSSFVDLLFGWNVDVELFGGIGVVKPGRFTGGNRTQAVTSSNSTQRIVTCVVAVTF